MNRRAAVVPTADSGHGIKLNKLFLRLAAGIRGGFPAKGDTSP